MHSKFEKFNELLRELKIETAKNLSGRDLVHLAHTSKYHLALFKPVIDVRKFLHHVTRGEHDVVKAMLKKDISLIFQRGFVTDCSGREFKDISGFEYALWALDKHMWAAMIECIPRNEEGRKIFKKVLVQYEELNMNRLTYRLNGKTITEKHFDFKNTIIKELQTQVDLINAEKWDVIHNLWREGVGGAQKRLPMHVVNEYCSDAPFYPVPKFTSQPKSSKYFYNWTNANIQNWFDVDSKLSVDFAIFKGGLGVLAGCYAVGRGGRRVPAACDLNAMNALCEVRTQDFINLKSQLEEQASLEYHHQVVPM